MKKLTVLGIAALSAGATFLAISLVSGRSVAVAPTQQEAFISAAESTVGGVVSVKSYATPRMSYGNQEMYIDPFFEYFFGGAPQPRQRQQPRAEQQQIGLGSGVIIDKEGYIVTNNHVIADAERLEVTLNDNRNFNATVIGSDPATDLALIKIDAPDDLHVIPMGNSEDLHVGEWVLAVGNPFGFTSTVTSGIVSAKGRNIGASTQSISSGNIESYIQTDAALNSGNSGGALVNLDGELVGINAAIYSKTGTYAGCSFAIPTSIVKKVVADLKEFGTVQRAFLGVTFTELTPEIIKKKDIKDVNAGILVISVADRSAAKEAGLQPDDVIYMINNELTTTTAALQEAIAKCSPGDQISIVYIRDGRKYVKNVVLRNDKGDTSLTRAGSVGDLGCAFAAVDKEKLAQLEISSGVQVKGLEDGAMKEAGVRDGFIIITINGTRVNEPSDIDRIYSAIMASSDDKVMFIKGIYPTGKRAFYAVSLE